MIALIVNPIIQRNIKRVVFSFWMPNITYIPSAGKIISKFMERNGHDSISGVKCFFHTVTVMNVDIHIQNTLQRK